MTTNTDVLVNVFTAAVNAYWDTPPFLGDPRLNTDTDTLAGVIAVRAAVIQELAANAREDADPVFDPDNHFAAIVAWLEAQHADRGEL